MEDDGTRMRKSYVIFGGLVFFFVAVYYLVFSSTPTFAGHGRWEYKVEKFEIFRPDPAEYLQKESSRGMGGPDEDAYRVATGELAVRYYDDLWGTSHQSFGEILDKNGKRGWIYVGMEHFKNPGGIGNFPGGNFAVSLPGNSIYRAEKSGIGKAPYQTLIFKRPL